MSRAASYSLFINQETLDFIYFIVLKSGTKLSILDKICKYQDLDNYNKFEKSIKTIHSGCVDTGGYSINKRHLKIKIDKIIDYKLVIDKNELILICAILGCVGGSPKDSYRMIADRIHYSMRNAIDVDSNYEFESMLLIFFKDLK